MKVGDKVYIPLPETGRELEKKTADKWNRKEYTVEFIKGEKVKLVGLEQHYYKYQLQRVHKNLF